MTLGETAELQVSSAFAFGSRSVGEGENVVPPNSDITFVVTLVVINDLHGAVIKACPATYPSVNGTCKLQIPNNVHFEHVGREFCGGVVAAKIVEVLKRRSQRPPRSGRGWL